MLAAPDMDGVEARAEDYPMADVLADQLSATLRPGGVLLVLEVRPELGVHVAARLNALQMAHVVLVLSRWPYRQATLPTDCLLHSLLGQSRRLRRDATLPNVVFVLDAERGRPLARRSTSDPRADNRYQLSPADLPNLATLRARGIHRVVKVHIR